MNIKLAKILHQLMTIFIGSLLVVTLSQAQTSKTKQKIEGNITFYADKAYPESVTWSPKHKMFFVGSLRNGTIGTISSDGKYRDFASDRAMFGSAGIKYDEKRNLIWVALCDIGISVESSARTQGKTAAVIAFDATTGKTAHYIDLASLVEGAHCANDIAFDKVGNIYVTDSFAPVVYIIDSQFSPRVLVKSDKFLGENFNLNGIAYHPDGYLLVGKHNTGELFRITLKPHVDVQSVTLSIKIPGADGMELIKKNTLIVAQNAGNNRAVELTSKDGWQSAEVREITRSLVSFPTAITTAGTEVYMLNNRVDTLLDPTAEKVSEYMLQLLPINKSK